MNTPLNSDDFHFSLNTDGFSWNLMCPKKQSLELKSVRMKVEYLWAGKPKQTILYWRSNQVREPHTFSSPLGELQIVDIYPSPDALGLEFKLSFAVSDLHKLFLWKLIITNHGNSPVQIERITLFDLGEAEKSIGEMSDPAFFSNSWGSWDHAGVFGHQDTFRHTRLGVFSAPMRINPGTPHPKQRGVFASDMFGVLGDRTSRQGWLVGFLSQEQHFGSIEVDFRSPGFSLWANGDSTQLDPGDSMETDWACIQFVEIDSPDPLGPYLHAVALQAGIDEQRFHDPIPTGWCSWYYFYNRVKEQDIRENLEAVRLLREQIPLSFIQIDDGFEARVGDWLDFSPDFPDGVSPLAQEIISAGFTPGLWLAPFIVDRRSKLAKEHPDWLLRGRFNLPVNAGFLWNHFATALDLTIPEALDYACQVIQAAVYEWKFPYLKLDFLYAGALAGKRADIHKTRAQILRTSLQAIRTAAGDQTFLLACGCPLGSAVGLVDAMRISADVDGRWNPVVLGRDIPAFYNEPGLPSARNAIQNTLSRAALHRCWWLNDPDCLLLREDTQLTIDEVQSLATTIALSGGLWALSDHLPTLSADRLKIAQSLLPPIGQRPEVLDWFDAAMPQRVRLDLDSAWGESWLLLALFNWDDQRQELDFSLPDYNIQTEGTYWLRDFWQGDILRIRGDESIEISIAAHGVRLFAVRALDPNSPVYLGSSLHISQGLEVIGSQWQADEGTLDLDIERPGHNSGIVELSLPGSPLSASLDGNDIKWASTSTGSYQFTIDFTKQALLSVRCAKNSAP